MLRMMPAWQPVGPRVLGATAAACRHATPPQPRAKRRTDAAGEPPICYDSKGVPVRATLRRADRTRDSRGAPAAPRWTRRHFGRMSPGAAQRHPRARRPLCSAAKALSPTEPGGETRVEATCVNARRKVGTDPRASCEKRVRPSFCLRPRGERGSADGTQRSQDDSDRHCGRGAGAAGVHGACLPVMRASTREEMRRISSTSRSSSRLFSIHSR